MDPPEYPPSSYRDRISVQPAWRMVKKLRLLKGGSVPTFVGLGPVLHNKLAVDA